jgi:D-glycero-alpha-D-manno-heptose-7-phosphate kinase
MIISKTPYRVSFFGGGTDYPHWYKNSKFGGKTISCAIDKFSYIILKKLPSAFNYNYRIRYSASISFGRSLVDFGSIAIVTTGSLT